MTKHQGHIDRKALFLALLAGICGNASWAALTSQHVAFSGFPIIAFLLAIYALYQNYLSKSSPQGTTAMAFGCFIVGILGYSALLKVELPDTGSNYFTLMVMLVVAFWVAHKSGITKPKAALEKNA